MSEEIISDPEITVAEVTSALNQRSEELAVINSVQEALSKKIDIQGIYDLVGDRIRDMFNAQVVCISTFNLEEKTEKFEYMVEKGERFFAEPRPLGKLRVHLVETKKKIIINTREEGIAWFGSEVIPGTEPIKSAVFVPMVIADKITGYITLQNIDSENAFSDADISLLETLANSMAVALENARLFDETNRLLKETEQGKAELAVINSVQEGLVREMDIQGIYNLVGDRIRELFNAQVVGIASFDHATKMEHFNFYIEKGQVSLPNPRPFDKVRQHLIQTGQNILINENVVKAVAEFGMKVIPGTEMPKSILFMPLKVGDKVNGYVSLQNIDQEHAFSFSDVRLLSTLSNSMSVALQNAKLFDETNRLLKETEQRKAELAVINSVQEGLAKELDMQGIYDLVGDRVQKLFNAQAVIISSFDFLNKAEQFNYVFENGEKVKIEPRPISKLRQTLIDKRRTIYIETERQAQEEYGLSSIANTQMPKSLLFVPLLSGSDIRGYVSLQNIDKEHAFTDSDIRLLETLSNSMSVALENARLFDETNRLLKETEQQKGELAVINSVQDGLAKALDMQAIYDLVGNRIRDLFDAQVVGIATFDHALETEHVNYLIEKGERYYPAPRPLNILRKHLIDSKEKILINKNFDEVAATFGVKKVPGTGQPKSALYVPLVIGEKVTGYTTLQNLDKENAFSDSDVRLLETLANTMGVALENARLFDETTRLLKETEQQKAELGVINSVQEGLAKELDIQAIYDLIGDRIRELFNAQAVVIATFDHETAIEHFKYIIEDGQRFYLAARPYDKLRQHLIISRQKIVINTNYEEAYGKFGLKTLPGTNMTKSGVFVPLIIGDKVNSYISLQNNEIENAFSDSDVRLLETLANSMSVALENARLFDETNRLLKETEQRTAELAVINSVQEGLAKELDMQAIYELVGNKIQKVFNAQAVLICTFDHERGLEHFNYHIEKGEISYPDPRPYDKLRKTLIETREKIYINKHDETTAAKYSMKVVPGTELPKSLLFVPLVSGDKVKSYVSLQNIDKENAFSEADIRLLETLANSMSVALENARLFDETNRLLKETEQRTSELAVINSVQEGLVAQMDMQSIYDLVGEKVRQIFNAQVVDIVTYNKTKNLIEDRYAYEKGDRTLLEAREPKGFRKQVIKTGQVILINEDLAKRMQENDNEVLIGEISKSILFVPLILRGEVNGIISLQNVDEENAFSDSDVSLLTTLANSMSVALESASLFHETNRLLKETEQRTAELAVINSVQEGLAHELDMQGIYSLVGDRVQKLFSAQTVIIASFDHDNKMEHFHYNFEKGELFSSSPRALTKLRERLIDERHTIYIETEKSAIEDFGITPIEGTQMPRSLLFVPLMAATEIRGYVSLQNIDKENAFSESDVRLLETLANSMSVALENARLFDETNRLLKETEQRTAELGIINGVQEGLASKLDIQAIYDLVGDKIRDVFDTQGLAMALYDRKTNFIRHHYYFFKGKRIYDQDFELGKGLTSHIIKTAQPLLINENAVERYKELGAVFASTEEEDAAKSWLGVPLISNGAAIGTIRLENYEREFAYTQSDVSLLQTLASSMSVALENARLFDETTHLLSEAKQRATELSTVNSISKALASQLDADELIQLVGGQMKDLFTANIVYLALLNKKNNTIYFPYQFGDDNAPIQFGEGLTSQIIKTGEPLLINKDVQELTAKLGVEKMGKAAASYLGVPIPVGDENVGVLSVQSTEHENQFNENDLRLLSTIAASVGVALNNATLFEEVKQAKMEAEAASKAAEKANEAKSAFLSTVSHELRTPLTSVLGFAKIIRKRLDEKIFPLVNREEPKTEKVVNQITENLQVVISEGERLTHLINDVLDLAKIEAGKMEWSVEDVSMSEVAERAMAATTSLFDQKSLKLEKHIEADLPPISGDRDKLIQVIINLISNAVKFTDKGSVSCKVYKKKNELIVGITDTGIGIAQEDFDAVFEQFKQVGGDTLTDKPKGTGLGLPICKEIVEHHGGRIWLESKPGKGSTFSFALPLSKTEKVAKQPVHLDKLLQQLKEQMANTSLQSLAKNSTILIVDDDDSIRSLLNQELSDAGYLIEQAVNGKDALERVRQHRPDLIILDIMMPEMNGFDVAAILKNDPQTMDIPIIVLSIVQDKARGFRIGVDRYLTKPIDTAQLFAEVGTLLEQGKSKKKVMVVDEDSDAVNSLTAVLETKGYSVVKSNGKGLIEKAVSDQPDIIILNCMHSDKQEVIQTLRFEKGLENVLFLIYQ